MILIGALKPSEKFNKSLSVYSDIILFTLKADMTKGRVNTSVNNKKGGKSVR